MTSSSTNPTDGRLDQLENRINNIQQQNTKTQERFDQLDGQLNSLTDQLGKLVAIATNAAGTEPPEATEEESTNADDDSESEYYSHHDDDDEKILTFDATEPEPEMETATNVEINYDQPEESLDSSLDPTQAKQPADEQLADTFETPTHGLDEDVVSSADATTQATTLDSLDVLEPGSLASQLMTDDFPENNELEADNVEETQKESSFHSTSSVADLLARMKEEGQWDGIPEGDEELDPVEPAPEPVLESPVDPPSEDEGDVEDYMSQLLNRMRGDGEPAQTVKPTSAPRPTRTSNPEPKAEETFAPPENPLKPDEFKPSRKAQKIDSLDAMRQIANSSARIAVHKSEQQNRKELGILQIGISVFSYAIAAYYFANSTIEVMDTGFIIGVLCICLGAFLTIRCYMTMRHNVKIEESLIAKANTKPAKATEDSDQTVANEAQAE